MKKIIALFFISTHAFAQSNSQDYPNARIDSTKDTYFGQTVNDPYRWLENDTLPETRDWVKEETEYSGSYLRKLKNKYSPENQLKLNSYVNFGTINKSGIYYFDFKKEGANDNPSLYIKKEIDGADRLIIDPADYKLERQDKVAIKEFKVSDDNKHIAFSLSYNGSDWHEIHVKSLYPFHNEDDVITGVKFSGIEWYKDGFFYQCYSMQGNPLLEKTQQPSIWYHKLGTTKESDLLVYLDPQFSISPISFSKISRENENYLIINNHSGGNTHVLALKLDTNISTMTTAAVMSYQDKDKKIFLLPDHIISQWKIDTIIISHEHASFNVIGIYNDRFLVSTTLGAPRGRLVLFEKNKKNVASEFVPEHSEVLQKASIIGKKVVCVYLDDIDYVSVSFDSTGAPAHKITFPTGSSVDGFAGDYSSPNTIFYQYSFLYPPIAYEYNVEYEGVTLIKTTQVTYNFKDFELEKFYYNSKDGTKIPILLAHKKGLKANGKNPTLLYGYGGYGIVTTPFYDKGFISFMQNGGIVAIPCIRGGGEYGEEWHDEGKLLNKENVFDDFISAAEFLINKNYTCSDKLAIMGGSNGGLLVAAVLNKRPDICKVAIAKSGVYDMLRFREYTIGRVWENEYGSVKDPVQFANLYHYSPVHNVRDTAYPAILVVTSDHDDRVVPMHSYKYVAALQKKNKGEEPVLLYVQKNMGHQDQDIELDANIYSLLYDELDMHVHMVETQFVR